jgi:hypothetical protein
VHCKAKGTFPTGYYNIALPSKSVLIGLSICLEKRPDTVGELKSAGICVSYMPSLKAKKLEMLTPEKVVLER